ncbi:hypothetical protein A3843_01700 [Pseudovibrio exalbescens]|uniref:Uncharacterized protein n=1 Tax=Pseudovibrio exalbescens TaxID=197461 RepID=A0A1U7JLU7_9HYPH|nr:hypothetical protein A3843_01700 [Pseudovibrio exalbescens]
MFPRPRLPAGVYKARLFLVLVMPDRIRHPEQHGKEDGVDARLDPRLGGRGDNGGRPEAKVTAVG